MTPYSNIILEVCVDSPVSAAAAEEGGANRVELCADLGAGGTTPSAGVIANTRECIEIPIHVMIRPHGGWLTGDIDFEVMKYDLIQAKHLGIDGVVFGVLNRGREIDLVRMAELVNLARPLNITFHRAFDIIDDREKALEQLIELGIERVLTSGGPGKTIGNIVPLKTLVTHAANRIRILVGGGLTLENISQVRTETGAKEMHILSAVTNPAPQDAHGTIFPGRWVVDADKVRHVRTLLAS